MRREARKRFVLKGTASADWTDAHAMCCYVKVLTSAVRDSALRKIVRGQLNRNAIPGHQTNEVLPHLAGDMSYNLMAVLEFHPELSPGQRFDDGSRQLDNFFIRRHKYNKV